MVWSSSESDVQSCCVPRNHTLVTEAWGGTGDPSKPKSKLSQSKSQLALPVLGNLKVSCHSTSLDSSFLQHDRTHPTGGAWIGAGAAACRSLPSVPTCEIKAAPRGALAKAANPLHRAAVPIGGVPAPWGLTRPFLKHLQTPKSNLIPFLGTDRGEAGGCGAGDFSCCHPMSLLRTVGGWKEAAASHGTAMLQPV